MAWKIFLKMRKTPPRSKNPKIHRRILWPLQFPRLYHFKRPRLLSLMWSNHLESQGFFWLKKQQSLVDTRFSRRKSSSKLTLRRSIQDTRRPQVPASPRDTTNTTICHQNPANLAVHSQLHWGMIKKKLRIDCASFKHAFSSAFPTGCFSMAPLVVP